MVTVVGTVATVATPLATSPTRQTLRRLIAGSAGLNGVQVGIASNGAAVQSADTLVDASADGILDVAYDDDRFDGAWLYKCEHGSGAQYVAPELHRIASYSSSTGAVTIGRTFATSPISNVTPYEIHTHGIPISVLHDAIDWACDNTRAVRWYAIPGLVIDGDMQAVDTSDWGAPSNATAAKVVLPAEGRRVLRTTVAPSGYVPTSAIAIAPSRIVRLHAVVEPSIGATCAVVARDLTHAQDIDITWSGTVSTATSGRTYIAGRLQVPDGCTSIQLRLTGSGDWHAVAAYDVAHREVALPAWCVPYEQSIVATAYDTNAGSSSSHDAVRTLIPTPPRPVGRWWRLDPAEYPGLLMVQASAPHPRLTSDSDAVSSEALRQLVLGSLAYVYRVATRPTTMDTTRYELARTQALRDWQAMAMWANPLARHRPRWGA
jgi:hypothetical protein